MKHVLVSVIIPTKNEEINIKRCLKSITSQSYPYIESIVVDNHSTDKTVAMAKNITPFVLTKGPERTAQRNYGAKQAKGKYILFVDADMELSKNVIAECVQLAENNNQIGGIIIPEESVGEGFWAACKKLEKSFYVGNNMIEAARFFQKDIFEKVHGYDEEIVSAEDWELTDRVRAVSTIARISAMIYHHEGTLLLASTVKKKYYYARQLYKFEKKTNRQGKSMTVLNRYQLFFSHPRKLFSHPLVGMGMLTMKTCEFFSGGVGYLQSIIERNSL